MDFSNFLISHFNSFIFNQSTHPISGISLDSRTIKKGELFLPLHGHHFDGSLFLEQAYLHPLCSGIICTHNQFSHHIKKIHNKWIFIVPDPLLFYHQVATQYLQTKKIKTIAITGSNGKTSTKEYLKIILHPYFKVFATPKNFNNQIGLPSSILSIQDEEIAILELGMGGPGDIERLTAIINPWAAIITSIGLSHTEFIPSLKEIILEKIKISQLPSTLIKITSSHVQESLSSQDFALFKDFEVVNPQQIFPSITKDSQGLFSILYHQNRFGFPYRGFFQLENLSLAITIAEKLNLSKNQIEQQLFHLRNIEMRQETKILDQREFILDCYNANPQSMIEMIKAFDPISQSKILVLGDMLELGKYTIDSHQQIIDFTLHSSFDRIILVGPIFNQMTIKQTHQLFYCVNNSLEAIPLLKKISKPQDLILLKASRGINLEKIIQFWHEGK